MSFNFTKPHTPRSYAARTDVGSVREHNEDSYLAKSPLFVVADGMGGHEAGEVASKIAIDTMEARMPKSSSPELLSSAVVEANASILSAAANGTGRPGMGTTITAALVFDDEVTVAQIGDSRAYLLHNNGLERITRDHSLVADLIDQGRLTEAEARFHPQRSVITRALGSDPHTQPDLYTLRVEEGDRLLLCSDGLSSMVTDEAIEALLIANPSPTQACDALVDEALASGGLDNVTVIVVDPLGDPPEDEIVDRGDFVEERVVGVPEEALDEEDGAEREPEAFAETVSAHAHAPAHSAKGKAHSKKPKRKGRFAPLIWAIAFLLILAGAAFGFYTYAQNSYYIIAENGIVSVYRGLPGRIGSLSVSWLEEQAVDVDVSKLSPTTQSRLANGISVNSLEDANNLLAEYRLATGRTNPTQSSLGSSSTSAALSKSTNSSSASVSEGGRN